MAACAGSTGIPLSVLKSAKRAGCPAFNNTRVELRPLLLWLFSDRKNEDTGPLDWPEHLRKFQALREELKYEVDQKAVMKFEVAEGFGRDMVAFIFAELEKRFCQELPPQQKGLTEGQFRALAETMIGRFKEQVTRRLEEFRVANLPIEEGEEE